jgi:ADP-heptose:LPS heptosyltransferase
MALQAAESPHILVPVLAGIGNAIMAVPLVRRLATLGSVTVAARTGAMADVFAGVDGLSVIVLGAGHGRALRRHQEIARSVRPDLYVVPFPSNRWQYALLAAASGAGRVVMHEYPTGGWRALRFLPRRLRTTTFIAAERGIHDVVQNLRLAEALGAGGPLIAPSIHVTDADGEQARRLLEGDDDVGSLVLLQPGCGDTPVGRAKRWPVGKMAQLADALADRGKHVALIEGPDERGVGDDISRLAASRPRVIQLAGPLRHAAALLKMSRLYVGTDSGLAHLAAAVGTPPVTLFAAADPARVAPFGYEHLVVTPPPVNGQEWRPRLMYPMDHPGPRLRRSGGIDWASQIRVEDVLAAVERAESTASRRDAGMACAGASSG